jgi:hypothetical protein
MCQFIKSRSSAEFFFESVLVAGHTDLHIEPTLACEGREGGREGGLVGIPS